MRAWLPLASVTLILIVGACGGGADAGEGEGEGELTEMVARAGDLSADGGDAGAPEGEQATSGGTKAAGTGEETDPATKEEVAALCTLYRKALRGRWDDGRTREEVRGLELSSARALAWRSDLSDGDVDTALDASREVVAAGLAFQLTSECEPLRALVSTADDIREAPDSLKR